ncbi:MAG: hydantoinase B/oxoprolinase family protein [Alphaproteobacteria bacterium]|nr:hydantoinase B/oxoprolinase family protein [Alphaproteobacteria bacterium]
MAACDAVTLEIVRGALRAAQAETEALLERTAMSDVIREKKDYFTGYFGPEGKLITGTPLPLFGHIIRPILRQFPAETMRPGDLYWYNDCYASDGGVSHLNDQVFAAPVFCEGKLSGFAQSWAHFTDIGGMRPGSMSPDATEIFQEGLMVPPVRLYREGKLNAELFRIFIRNSRFPQQLQGDTRALIAAVRLGEKRLLELFARFGRDSVLDAFAKLDLQTEAHVRKRLRTLFPPGRSSFVEAVESDGHGNGPFKLRLAIDVADNGIVVDATATDDQAPGPINWLMNPAVPQMIFGIFLSGEDPTLMLNEGLMHAIDEVRLRPGSLLKPDFPAPLGQRGLTMVRMVSACNGLMCAASGGEAGAGIASYALWYLRTTDPASGETLLMNDGVAVGFGGRPQADGHDAVYFVAQENNPAEYLDQLYPARLLRYAINRDSGGAGRHRGGCGVIREIEWLGPDAMLANRLSGTIFPPWGVKGGKCGGKGRVVLNPGRATERVLPPIGDGTTVRKGDVIRIETGGGGGWGDPFAREPERVLADVLGGFVSERSARADYGVALAADGRSVDAAATRKLRSNPPPVRMFHQGEYVDALS